MKKIEKHSRICQTPDLLLVLVARLIVLILASAPLLALGKASQCRELFSIRQLSELSSKEASRSHRKVKRLRRDSRNLVKLLEALALGGPDWHPLDQTMVRKVARWIGDHNYPLHGPRSRKRGLAESSIQEELRQSVAFRELDSNKLSVITEELTRGGAFAGPEAINGSSTADWLHYQLNRFRLEYGLVSSRDLKVRLEEIASLLARSPGNPR